MSKIKQITDKISELEAKKRDLTNKVISNQKEISEYEQLSQKRNNIIEKLDELKNVEDDDNCLLYTSPSPRDQRGSRMPSSA